MGVRHTGRLISEAGFARRQAKKKSHHKRWLYISRKGDMSFSSGAYTQMESGSNKGAFLGWVTPLR
jgi:hypothetical protein